MGKNGKSSEGRKKVEMKKIESEEARQVCFSKRKKGIFAKASELSTMCGAEVALLLHSPRGTPYSFGSPSADKVFNQFMTGEQSSDPADPNAINELNQEYMELTERLDVADAKKEALEERMKQAASEAKECVWLDNIDQLGRDELLQLLGSLYRAKCSVNERMRFLSGQDGGAGLSNMDASTSMPPNAGTSSGGMDLSVAPSPPNAPDGSSNT